MQQSLPFTVCAAGCRTAEEQSEGKTKMMKQQYLLFTVLKRFAFDAYHIMEFVIVAIVLTVYGIETYRIKGIVLEQQHQLQQYLLFTVLKRLNP